MLSNNTAMTQPTWAAFTSFWAGPSFRIYMPLAMSIWQLIAVLFHGDVMKTGELVLAPMPYKCVSILTHALAAASATWTLSTLTRTRWPAIVGALLFALHPVQVESVAWTTGLKDELCGLFSVLSIGLYARHAEKNPELPWSDAWWWAALLTAVLAMSSKSTGAVLPAMLLAVDYTVRRCVLARRVVSMAFFLLPAIAGVLIIVGAQGGSKVAVVPLWMRPLVAADTYAFYLCKVIWPVNLAVDYGRRPAVVMETGAIWWSWVLPLIALVGVLLTRSRMWLLAAALFVVPVLPVSGLAIFDMQQYSTVTDHYLYQPMLGVGLVVAMLAGRRPVVGWAAAIAVCVLAVSSWRESTAWQNPAGLYARMMQTNPRSWMARDLLGFLATSRGDIYQARQYIRASKAGNPEGGNAFDNESIVAILLGKNRESADAAVKASERILLKRIVLARRLVLLGSLLKDREVAEKGVRYWLQMEPNNQYVLKMLFDIQRSKQHDRQKPTTNPIMGSPNPSPATQSISR